MYNNQSLAATNQCSKICRSLEMWRLSSRAYELTSQDTHSSTSDSKLNLNLFHSLHRIPYHFVFTKAQFVLHDSARFSASSWTGCSLLFRYAFVIISLGFIYTLFLIYHEMDCYFALMYARKLQALWHAEILILSIIVVYEVGPWGWTEGAGND